MTVEEAIEIRVASTRFRGVLEDNMIREDIQELLFELEEDLAGVIYE